MITSVVILAAVIFTYVWCFGAGFAAHKQQDNVGVSSGGARFVRPNVAG
jgi:hypothetical protein